MSSPARPSMTGSISIDFSVLGDLTRAAFLVHGGTDIISSQLHISRSNDGRRGGGQVD